MPRRSTSLPRIIAFAVLTGACGRVPARTAPVPTPVPVPEVPIDRGPDPQGKIAAAERLRRDVASDTTPAVSRRSSDTTRTGVPAKVTAADVSTETVRVFGDSAPPVAVAAVIPEAPGGPVWDIDVRSYETLARVEDYVRIFSGRSKDIFTTALERQTRYGPMIRERLRRVGLPENLTYLALVESWFNPHAYSRAAAVGLWQFMAGTARGMGLRVDWWVDERRDPVRSTEAAARLLNGLRKEFGSLYLAAAAYNGGSGRVSRGLARYAEAMDGVEGEDRFFALAEKSYLRPETRDYVPKIIAAALVGEQPGRYGVTVDSLAPYAYDSVRAPGGTPLAAVAKAMGAAPTEVAELNPALLRGMTPPRDATWVRVPVGHGAGFAARFAALEPAERQALARVVSKKGQSLASIARKHALTAAQLGWFNPNVGKLRRGALRAGQVVLVPRRDVVMLARDVPNPSIEKYPARPRASSARRTRAGSAKSSASKSAAKAGGKTPSAKAGAKKPAVKSGAKKPAVKSGAKKPAVKKPAAEPAER